MKCCKNTTKLNMFFKATSYEVNIFINQYFFSSFVNAFLFEYIVFRYFSIQFI